MQSTRREFGRLALATVPALALIDRSLAGATLAQARPNSVINGVRIGAITYSYRSMPDQSAEAVLKYVVDSGISEIELMNTPAEAYAGMPASGGGRGGGRGGGGRGRGGRGRGRGGQPEMTPEEKAAAQAAQQAAQAATRAWRLGVSMDKYKALRAMYNDAGVKIYAFKLAFTQNMTDDEYDYVFNVAEALGADHVTMELTQNVDLLKRIGEFAEKRKIHVAYHTHAQGSMTAFDQAFAVSTANMANVDVGHWIGANGGESPIPFFLKHHARISSFHLKDKTKGMRGVQAPGSNENKPWGEGDTPIVELLHLVRQQHWTMPATIELEYAVPENSDAVQEVAKCVDYCRKALL